MGTSAQGFSRYVPLRDHLHQRLCELPEADRPALAHYRQRVDTIAEVLYRRGIAEHGSSTPPERLMEVAARLDRALIGGAEKGL